jgi:hypothetical protein
MVPGCHSQPAIIEKGYCSHQANRTAGAEDLIRLHTELGASSREPVQDFIIHFGLSIEILR